MAKVQAVNERKPKIIVVGAGLAGLTTAYRLHQAGCDVEIYEARQRLGGRVFTVNIGEKPVELGGQNILDGGEAKHTLGLIKELDLEVFEHKNLMNIAFFDGQVITLAIMLLSPTTWGNSGILTQIQLQRLFKLIFLCFKRPIPCRQNSIGL